MLAYELETHERLSTIAYSRSVLADPSASPLLDFGVEDPSKPQFLYRPAGSHDASLLSAIKIISKGARYEDLPTVDLRFLRHFFDPQLGNIGLSIPGLPSAHPSPTWVLEDQGVIDEQDYSLRDALDHHRGALTLADQMERNERLAVLLEILGRSVHHLQDMAQPAHARNDAHPPGDGDIYERATDLIFRRSEIPSASPYPTPAVDLRIFDTARKFWTNNGRGIADFSSRNFVSMDTNFRRQFGTFLPDTNHPLPVPIGSTRVPLSQLGVSGGLPLSLTFVHSQINDAYSGTSVTNERASTYSIFNSDLEGELFPSMTLNRFNFERNYQELMPRAIAYSAGLINYYFRGRFKVEQVAEAAGVVTVTIRNVSEAEFPLQTTAETAGFQLFYDARDGVRRELAFQQPLPSSTWAFDETREFSFTRPGDVDARTEHPYLLVFDGVIGNERGLAATAFGEPQGGLLVTPKYPTSDAVRDPRTVSWRDGSWLVTEDTAGQAGTIDWKGNRAGDVLSWGATSARYHHATGGITVYMNGRALTTGPAEESSGATIGASIRYVNGERTLNVVKEASGGVRIYSRKFAHSYENEDPWSQVNPLGWRLVYAEQRGSPYTGFFFNASGNEGQYITRDVFGRGGPLRRVKVTLQGDQGFAVDYPAVATVSRTERNFHHDTINVSVDAGACQVRPSAPGGELVPASDACGTMGFSGNRNNLNIVSTTETYTDKTLLCVDYRGDVEVFCELAAPQGEIVRSSTHDLRIQQEFAAAVHCPDQDVRNHDVTERTTTNNNNARILKIGNVDIPWTAATETVTQVRGYAGSFLYPPDYAGSINGNSSHIDRTTKLIHADARHDFAVYESKVVQVTGSYTGSYSADGPDEYPYTGTTRIADRKEVIMVLGAQREVLFEAETAEETNRELTANRGTCRKGLGVARRRLAAGTHRQLQPFEIQTARTSVIPI